MRIIALLCFYSMLLGCTTTQEIPEGSPETIQQWLRESTAIEDGAWMRATTLDDSIHEFSYWGVTDDELHGGDTTIPITDLKQLEIFPFVMEQEILKKRKLVSDKVFLHRMLEYAATVPDQWVTLALANGAKLDMKSPRLEGSMLVGTNVERSDVDFQDHPVTRKVSVTNVVRNRILTPTG